MLNVAEISNSTAIIPLREGQRESIGGGVNLPLPAISFVTATNEETYSLPDVPWVLVRDMFPYGLLARTTGAELRECRLLQTVAHNSASDMVLTSYQTVHLLPDETFQRRSIPYSKPDVPAEIYSQSAQAKRLREISGLTVEHLASIFGVSRITYHKWMDGSLLSDRHKEHLLEILPLIEEALQRLGSPKAVNTWLLTPVSPGEKKPIEYLSSRQYSTFRGFLLRRHTSQRLFHPLVPSKRVYRERPREEIEEELERLNPGFRLDEDCQETSHGNE